MQSFLQEKSNSATFLQLIVSVDSIETLYETVCEVKLFLKASAFQILYHFSMVDNYGSFLVLNCKEMLIRTFTMSFTKAN